MKEFKMDTDIDHVEEWLNNLSKQGKAMIGCSANVYEFEDAAPGKYEYHIGFIRNMKPDYVNLWIYDLSKQGIEFVAKDNMWIYFRSTQPFSLYPTTKERSNVLKDIRNLYLEISTAFVTLAAIIGWFTSKSKTKKKTVPYFISAVLGLCGGFYAVQFGKYEKKLIADKKAEKALD
ncbi:MAG: DUF2812 domain-containing protein [Faecalicoccus sp.]|nr:DUF2812 domain-containing protein [Faecalicoccus sp.]